MNHRSEHLAGGAGLGRRQCIRSHFFLRPTHPHTHPRQRAFLTSLSTSLRVGSVCVASDLSGGVLLAMMPSACRPARDARKAPVVSFLSPGFVFASPLRTKWYLAALRGSSCLEMEFRAPLSVACVGIRLRTITSPSMLPATKGRPYRRVWACVHRQPTGKQPWSRT